MIFIIIFLSKSGRQILVLLILITTYYSHPGSAVTRSLVGRARICYASARPLTRFSSTHAATHFIFLHHNGLHHNSFTTTSLQTLHVCHSPQHPSQTTLPRHTPSQEAPAASYHHPQVTTTTTTFPPSPPGPPTHTTPVTVRIKGESECIRPPSTLSNPRCNSSHSVRYGDLVVTANIPPTIDSPSKRRSVDKLKETSLSRHQQT